VAARAAEIPLVTVGLVASPSRSVAAAIQSFRNSHPTHKGCATGTAAKECVFLTRLGYDYPAGLTGFRVPDPTRLQGGGVGGGACSGRGFPCHARA
jgi:hypothetical protein